MENPEHLEVLREGVEAWNVWRKQHPEIRPDLRGADLRGADLRGANLQEANLQEANLRGTFLGGAYLVHANLERARLAGADLGKTDLVGAQLVGADLEGANLVGANLLRANLESACLVRANLEKAKLRWTILARADLEEACLIEADLSWANLSRANLRRANLEGANFYQANLEKSKLRQTIISDTNLTKVRGLDQCYHGGPSILDRRTLARNLDLPRAFLQGCGLSDWEIEAAQLYNPDLSPGQIAEIQDKMFHVRKKNQPIQFYSCFISYTTKNEDFAKKLYEDLQNSEVRCWFAPEDMRGGQKIYGQITDAIRLHDKLLLILSEHSMRSDWVKTEIKQARAQESKEKDRRVLFPLSLVNYAAIKAWELFDPDEGRDLAAEVRSYYIPDFSNWRNDGDYQKSFDHLLDDLHDSEA